MDTPVNRAEGIPIKGLKPLPTGRHQNGDVLPDGVYYYELLRAGSGGTEAYTGYIHVLKGR